MLERDVVAGILKTLSIEKYGKSKYGISADALGSIIDAMPDDVLSVDLVRTDGHIPLVAVINHFLDQEDGDEVTRIEDRLKRWDFVFNQTVLRMQGNINTSPARILIKHINEILNGKNEPLPDIKQTQDLASIGLLDKSEAGYTVSPIVLRVFGSRLLDTSSI